jgi:hypothetical protein
LSLGVGWQGRASDASASLEELKALDVAVTGTQLERTIERWRAQLRDVLARYESGQHANGPLQSTPKKRVLLLGLRPAAPTHCMWLLRGVLSCLGTSFHVHRDCKYQLVYPIFAGRSSAWNKAESSADMA